MIQSLFKNQIRASVAVLTMMLLSTACGDSGTSKTTQTMLSGGSCNYAATGNCMEYHGAAFKSMTMQRLCESQKGVYAAGSCPAEGRLGACVKSKGTKDETRLGYYPTFPGFGVKLTPDAVVSQAQEQCIKFVKGEWLKP